MKILSVWLGLAGLLLTTATGQSETISGYVLNATNGEPVTDAEIAFLIPGEGQANEITRKAVDDQGRFSFSGPFISADLTFQLVAFYQGVPHPSSDLVVGRQKEIIMEVYDLTEEVSAIRLRANHLLLALSDTQLDVLQVADFDNANTASYAPLHSGMRRGAEFIVPEGIFNLESQSVPLTQQEPTRLRMAHPLLPGQSRITFTFSADVQRLDGGYTHQVRYPTERLEVLLYPADLNPGPDFADLGTVDFHGNQYRRLQAENLQPGQRLHIELPLSRPLRPLIKWVALGLALFAGVSALVFGPRQSPRTENQAELENRRLALLEALVQLEATHPDVSGKSYQNQRQQLLDQTAAIYRRLEDRHGHG